MTQVDVVFRFDVTPTERVAIALDNVRKIYGIRKMSMDERAKTVRVEYDSSRLTVSVIHQLLQRAGLDLGEQVAGYQQPEPVPAA